MKVVTTLGAILLAPVIAPSDVPTKTLVQPDYQNLHSKKKWNNKIPTPIESK